MVSVQSEFETMAQSLRDRLRDWTSPSSGASNFKERSRDEVDSNAKEDFATRIQTVQLHLNLPVRPLLVNTSRDFELARKALREAYAEDQVFKWLLGDVRKDPQASQKTSALLDWMVDWRISTCWRFSYCLAIPHRAQSDSGGATSEIKGCAFITCPGYLWSRQLGEMQQILALINSGSTPPALLGPQCKARFAALEHMSNARSRLADEGPHWRIHMLGVSPSQQRQGTGRLLMRIICALADQDALPVHLEVSGSRPRAFFEQVNLNRCGRRLHIIEPETERQRQRGRERQRQGQRQRARENHAGTDSPALQLK
jgi:ribosomal protein S18 acetylase RimI-like enzyme